MIKANWEGVKYLINLIGFVYILPEFDSETQSKLTDLVLKALKTLTPKEEDVLLKRCGIYETKQTLEEVGRKYMRSKERIRQVQAQALRKLRHPARSTEIKTIVKEYHNEVK